MPDLKARIDALTKQIKAARLARAGLLKLEVPKGAGRKERALLLKKLTAYIDEKVKNRKRLRKKVDPGPDPSDKPKSGPDVSSHQGSVDWKKVRADGHNFAFAKATEGVGYVDPTFSGARLKAMADAGLRVGAYHFARPDTTGGDNDARAEAGDFVAAIKNRGGKFISYSEWVAGKPGVLGALDFEHTPYSASWASAWGKEFQRLTGVKAVIYGGGYSLNPALSALDDFACVWLAAYVSDWKPYFNGPDGVVQIWQFTSSASVAGISGGCDLNRYIG